MEERNAPEILMVDADGVVVDRKLEEEDRVGGLVTSLALTLITNMIRDQILSILGNNATIQGIMHDNVTNQANQLSLSLQYNLQS